MRGRSRGKNGWSLGRPAWVLAAQRKDASSRCMGRSRKRREEG